MLPNSCTLDYHKDSEVRKHRYMTVIGGTQFTLYVHQWRTPTPTPSAISVRIWETTLIEDLTQQLSPIDKARLRKKGMSESEIMELDKLLPVRRETDFWRPVISHLRYQEEKGETVRYYPPVDDPELGEPYIPKDVLLHPYPNRLLIRVRWCTD